MLIVKGFVTVYGLCRALSPARRKPRATAFVRGFHAAAGARNPSKCGKNRKKKCCAESTTGTKKHVCDKNQAKRSTGSTFRWCWRAAGVPLHERNRDRRSRWRTRSAPAHAPNANTFPKAPVTPCVVRGTPPLVVLKPNIQAPRGLPAPGPRKVLTRVFCGAVCVQAGTPTVQGRIRGSASPRALYTPETSPVECGTACVPPHLVLILTHHLPPS